MKKTGSFVKMLLLLVILTVTLMGCGKKTEDESKIESETVVSEEKETDEGETDENEIEIEEEIPEEAEVVDTRTPIQKWWGGDWYGIMWFTYANGDYEVYNNQYWDAMATIDVDENGEAEMLLWYEAQDRDTPVANVELTISENSGSGEMGAAISESGWMFVNSDTGNGDVAHAQWIIDPMTDPVSTKYGSDMIHIEGEYLDGTGEIYYHFFYRKWGTLWDDVAKDPDMLTPGLYEEWYKPLVEAGYAMPQNIGDEGSVLMSEVQASGTASITGSEANEGKAATSSEVSSAQSTYDGGELVLVDDENCKIVIKGMGNHPYNESWVGYLVELTNKTDHSLYFTSYAEPDQQAQTIDSLGTGNTCIFKGEVTKTRFGETINAGTTYDKACIVIDGVTDVSDLGNVQGYISISNNETGQVLNNVAYSL